MGANLELVPRVKEIIAKHLDVVKGYNVSGSTEFTFVVSTESKWWNVNLDAHSCDCKEWDLSGIPCIHVVCVISHMTIEKGINWTQYCSPFLTIRMYRRTYADYILPPLHKTTWDKEPSDVLPPMLSRRPGRPRVNRKRGEDEGPSQSTKNQRKCSKCGMIGHNKVSCQGGLVAQKGRAKKNKGGPATEKGGGSKEKGGDKVDASQETLTVPSQDTMCLELFVRLPKTPCKTQRKRQLEDPSAQALQQTKKHKNGVSASQPTTKGPTSASYSQLTTKGPTGASSSQPTTNGHATNAFQPKAKGPTGASSSQPIAMGHATSASQPKEKGPTIANSSQPTVKGRVTSASQPTTNGPTRKGRAASASQPPTLASGTQ
ncbi:hypothetical protein IFM89_025587 [Coptis chinensis]|uniref:SWIM-type domain-containing protein n=1 Tax=Coptis chinensis TaxID=261450 RepID=A0A835LMN3_9MAGN|nr:hypothetical protein IFM89_025587 [Coptis chinensis]